MMWLERLASIGSASLLRTDARANEVPRGSTCVMTSYGMHLCANFLYYYSVAGFERTHAVLQPPARSPFHSPLFLPVLALIRGCHPGEGDTGLQRASHTQLWISLIINACLFRRSCLPRCREWVLFFLLYRRGTGQPRSGQVTKVETAPGAL